MKLQVPALQTGIPFGSVGHGVHVAPHACGVFGQPAAATHAPFEQTWSHPQANPHAPQLFASVRVSTHASSQLVRDAGHFALHVPATHAP